MLSFKFKPTVKRADKSNAIDLYITSQIEDHAAWLELFETPPPAFSEVIKGAWMKELDGVVCASDAFFPFSDNVQRCAKSGVKVIAAPKGSVMDSVVIAEAEEKGITFVFTDVRLFHH